MTTLGYARFFAASTLAVGLLSSLSAAAKECVADSDCSANQKCEIVATGGSMGCPPCAPDAPCPPCDTTPPAEEKGCVDQPIACTTDADCPTFLSCTEDIPPSVCASCPAGGAPCPPCETPAPSGKKTCSYVQKSCTKDADCAAGLSCQTSTVSECTGSAPACPPDADCPAPPEPSCTTATTSSCQFTIIECKQSADCPTDFSCETVSEGVCGADGGSVGTGGGTSPGGGTPTPTPEPAPAPSPAPSPAPQGGNDPAPDCVTTTRQVCIPKGIGFGQDGAATPSLPGRLTENDAGATSGTPKGNGSTAGANTEAAPASASDDGCSTSVAGRQAGSAWSFLALAAGLFGLAQRRRNARLHRGILDERPDRADAFRMRLPGRSFFGTCFVGVSLLVASSAHAADYGATGPFKTLTKTIGGVVGLEGKIAYPDTDSGSYPVVILAHGFSSSPDNMIGWGEHLASHGFVAVALKNCGSGFLCTPDPNAEVGLVKKTLQYVESGLAPAGVTDQADASRFLLLGHSAGGQAVTVAAAAFAPMGLVLFDPVGGGQSETDAEPAKSALAKICAPTLTVFAEPHKTAGGVFAPSCNKNGAWQDFANTSSGPRTSLVVEGSTHCDGELPSRNTCGIPCGGAANATRQAVYRRYATAFALATLTNDDAAKATLTLAAINADSAVTAGSTEDGPACPGAGGQGGGGSGGGNAGEAGAGGTTSGEAGAGGGSAGEPGAGGSEAGAAGESSGEAGNGGEGGSAVGGSSASAGKSGSGATGGNAQGGGGSKAGGAAGGTAGAAGSEPVPVNDVGLAVDDSGCGCRLSSERSSNRAGLLVASGIALFAARRRRR